MAAKKKQKQASPKQEPAEKKPKASVGMRYWAKRFYIPGFGFVDQGDEASKEALAAWAKKTKLNVDNYLK